MQIIRGDNSWDTDEHDFRKVTLLAEDTNLHTTLQYEKGEEIDVSNWKLKDWEEAVEIYKYAEGADYGQNEFTYLFLKHVGPKSEYLESFNYRTFENKKKFGEYVYWYWFGIAEMSLYVNYEDIAHDAIADVLNAGGVVFDWGGKLHVWITPEANLWERLTSSPAFRRGIPISNGLFRTIGGFLLQRGSINIFCNYQSSTNAQ